MDWLSWLYVLFLLCGTCQYICCSSSSLNSSSCPFPYQHFCNCDDSSALLQFKNTFLVSASVSSSCFSVYFKTVSWEKDNDCCKWNGVTCEKVTGHVVGLDLSCSGLHGNIHHNNSLFSLGHLQRLSLSGNDFSGSPVSSNFGRFVSLTHLDLSFSNFSGHIPSELSHLSRLVSLDLSANNQLYTFTYLRLETLGLKRIVQNLTNLRELVLDGVDMSSVLPDSFMNLTFSLTYLSLYDCHLHGQFPWSLLLKLDQLVHLDLSSNNFFGQLPIVHRNSTTNISSSLNDSINKKTEPADLMLLQLEQLDLSYNSFIGAIPSWIYSLPSLASLYLSNNRFTGTISKFQSTSLTDLDLSYNKLHGQIPISIFELPNLSLLSLEANNLSGVVEFDKLQRLEYIWLSYNHLSVSFNNLSNSSWPNLTYVYLSSCNISEFPYILRYSPQLESLDLSYNQLQGKVPTWFMDGGKDTLRYLNLSHNFLTGNIEQLPWRNLKFLDLESNLLQGQVPIPPPSIVVFSISNNQLTGRLPPNLCNLSSIQILDLSSNRLSGKLPSCLANFSDSLSVLDLRKNKLVGLIPATFKKGNVLRNLDLNGNQLDGPLPQSLRNCRNLEVLDLGNNYINDTFPKWLETLPMLQVLILRSNRFHGPISSPITRFPFQKMRIMDLSHNHFCGPLPTKYFENLLSMINVQGDELKYMGEYYYQDTVVVAMKGSELQLVKIQTFFTTIDFSNNAFRNSNAYMNTFSRNGMLKGQRSNQSFNE
ncbi:hypothetical protein M0R45_015468 [Rubus argutus]|uniref:Leucine-rich repeat-containing N-terminal plant-type domain-containing protein n=1 Tax=Rubus argutus TaxID=59490 RepID=A0AAW1XPC7_RUBAR